VEAATELGDSSSRILAHRLLGAAYVDLERHEEGLEQLYRALALAERGDDVDQLAHTHRSLSLVWARRQDDRQAHKHAGRACDLYRGLDQPVWEADALNSMARHAARLGQFDTARDHCEAALQLARCHNYADAKADAWDTLGYIAHHTGNDEQAIDYYRQAYALFTARGYAYFAAKTLTDLGHAHVALGQHEQARETWHEALELYRKQERDSDAEQVRRQLEALTEVASSDGQS
jgi:tetratricopeptide (TPR) repeat protein